METISSLPKVPSQHPLPPSFALISNLYAILGVGVAQLMFIPSSAHPLSFSTTSKVSSVIFSQTKHTEYLNSLTKISLTSLESNMNSDFL